MKRNQSDTRRNPKRHCKRDKSLPMGNFSEIPEEITQVSNARIIDYSTKNLLFVHHHLIRESNFILAPDFPSLACSRIAGVGVNTLFIVFTLYWLSQLSRRP